MISACLVRLNRIHFFSYLKPVSGLYFSTKLKHTSLVPKSSLLKQTLPILIQYQTLWETFPSSRPILQIKDGLDRENYDIIYRSKIFYYAFYTQLFSMVTLGIQFVYSSYLAYKVAYLGELATVPSHVGPYDVNLDLMSLIILIGFTCQNILLYHLAQRAVLRVYHKKDTNNYVFVTLSFNPFKSRLIAAEPGDLINRNIENIMAMFGNYIVKDRKFFLKLENFNNVFHYNRLLGLER